LAAAGQRPADITSRLMTPLVGSAAMSSDFLSACVPNALARVVSAWPDLPSHIQQAIVTLVDAVQTDKSALD
jgi:hypothetical protein